MKHTQDDPFCSTTPLEILPKGGEHDYHARKSDSKQGGENKSALHFMTEIRPFAVSWTVLYFKLSKLNLSTQTISSLEGVKIFLEKQTQGHMARVFLLSNHDIIVFVQNIGPLKIERVVNDFCAIFARHFSSKTSFDTKEREWSHNFPLSQKFDWLFESIQQMTMQKTIDLSDQVPLEGVAMLPFDLMLKLQNSLRQADLSNFIRKQSLCVVESLDQSIRPVGCEYYVSMENLEKVLQSQSHLISDFALFKYLSIMFDKKMLSTLSGMVKHLDPSQNFHMNLNLRTVVSKEFVEFHSAIQRSCVVEIDRTDLLWDLEGFYFACDFLKSHGHKICVDLLFGANIALFKNLSLDCDYYKIVAAQDMLQIYEADISDFIDYVGAERVIFVRCDALQSVEFGINRGVKQFQGFLLDKALRQPKTPLNHVTM